MCPATPCAAANRPPPGLRASGNRWAEEAPLIRWTTPPPCTLSRAEDTKSGIRGGPSSQSLSRGAQGETEDEHLTGSQGPITAPGGALRRGAGRRSSDAEMPSTAPSGFWPSAEGEPELRAHQEDGVTAGNQQPATSSRPSAWEKHVPGVRPRRCQTGPRER